MISWFMMILAIVFIIIWISEKVRLYRLRKRIRAREKIKYETYNPGLYGTPEDLPVKSIKFKGFKHGTKSDPTD